MGKTFLKILREAYKFPRPEEAVIKAVTKEWLRTVSLPDYDKLKSTRELLIALVDEPEQC